MQDVTCLSFIKTCNLDEREKKKWIAMLVYFLRLWKRASYTRLIFIFSIAYDNQKEKFQVCTHEQNANEKSILHEITE